tara:strand:+ start:380 stop:1597 length:1218 start_codon:yes stop_codon:yes gene_type:complete
MAFEFPMPKLGLTMESGTIIEWLIEDGIQVESGTPILLIETDKTETEVEASNSGIFHRIGSAGQTYECGQLIGWFLEPGETPPTIEAIRPPEGEPENSLRSELTTSTTTETVPEPSNTRIKASPSAKRKAEELNVDLSKIQGSGPGGRITVDDVESASIKSNDKTVFSSESENNSSTTVNQTLSQVTPISRMRKTIAKRLHTSLRDMAQLTLTVNANMDAIVEYKSQYKDSKRSPSYTDFVIFAVARSLMEYPFVNSQFNEDEIILLQEINIGMAVALDEGLVVPVVKNANSLSLNDLSIETSRLANAAQKGDLSLKELEGGTFSITSLGMYGVDVFTPIINPPNTAILGIGQLRDGITWSEKGQPEKTAEMTLSLTWDHRAFDGAPAAEFARSIKRFLETTAQW